MVRKIFYAFYAAITGTFLTSFKKYAKSLKLTLLCKVHFIQPQERKEGARFAPQ